MRSSVSAPYPKFDPGLDLVALLNANPIREYRSQRKHFESLDSLALYLYLSLSPFDIILPFKHFSWSVLLL